ncbi:MAG TPA: hypothetical protein VHH32_00095, partial [Gemmatimonadales bacterium]|nr:hypothetical protein [Gemmatimonadales bacterium]
MRHLVTAGFLGLTATTLLPAQTIPGPPFRPSPADCRAGANALTDRTSDDWRWQLLPNCGSYGARVLARALRSARAEIDPDYLDRLYGAMAVMRNPDVFEAALTLMQDEQASAEARSTAVLIAVAQHDADVGLPLNLLLPDALRTGSCRLLPIVHGGHRVTAPLPADYLSRLGAALYRLSADQDTPDLLETFVNCARTVTSGAIADAVPTSAIRLTYLCDNRFRVDNASTESVQVSYHVIGTEARGTFSVWPKASFTFTARKPGSTSLYYRGRLVQTVENRGTSCTRGPRWAELLDEFSRAARISQLSATVLPAGARELRLSTSNGMIWQPIPLLRLVESSEGVAGELYYIWNRLWDSTGRYLIPGWVRQERAGCSRVTETDQWAACRIELRRGMSWRTVADSLAALDIWELPPDLPEERVGSHWSDQDG